MIRVLLPLPLRTLARVDGEVELHVERPVTQRSVLDALEARYPALRGTIRTHETLERRAFVRFFACEQDITHESPDAPLPDAVATGEEPFLVVGAIAGGWGPEPTVDQDVRGPAQGDAPEPAAAVKEPFVSAAPAAARPVAAARVLWPGKASSPEVPRSETVTLVCAVMFAVALGIACGAWINTRLASAASGTHPAPARLLPVTAETGQTSPAPAAAAEPRPDGISDAPPAADEIATTPDSDVPLNAEAPRTSPAGMMDRESVKKRDTGANAPAAGGTRPPARFAGRPGGVPEVGKKAAARQGRSVPCALYASEGSLNIRNGGAATLVVGGPGGAGRVSVTTPDWSHISVFSEGRAGGNGWLRYSVRSVSRKPGVYTVRVTSPCGSQDIPVTVGRP